MRAVRSIALAVLLTGAALPLDAQPDAPRPDASIQTLLLRPDLRPSTVTTRREFRFQNGTIAEGTELRVYDVSSSALVLDTGEFIFEAAHEDTDLLERLGVLIASLSDEALAVSEAAVVRDTNLWPARVTLTADIAFTDGTGLASGTVLPVREVQPGAIKVFDKPSNTILTIDTKDTDAIARARAIVDAPGEPRPFFVRSIEAALAASDTAKPEPVLADADYILVYRGSSTCSRCERFTPELLDAYADLKQQHDNFEVVFVSDDRTAGAHRDHIAKTGMPWTVIPFDRVDAAAKVRSLPGRILPIVYLMRPDGSVIDSTNDAAASEVVGTLREQLRSG